jgi:hypothetical protein
MGFIASKIYFYFGTISMFWNYREHEQFHETFYCQIGKQMIFLQVSGAAREERYEYCTIMRETKLISNLFKRNNFQVISQFIHVKDISKVYDNGNQYKQKLILWYWTTNYFLMDFVSSTFLYNGNSKCYVVRILYAISFQWSKSFGLYIYMYILCWKCQILSSLIENLPNIKTYTVIFGMQISHL